MQTLRMKRELLPALLEALKAWGTLHAPVERGQGAYSIEPIDDVSRARPEALRTILPVKKLLLPPRMVTLRSARGRDGRLDPVGEGVDGADGGGRKVYFGAHACDVHALRVLDLIYLSDYADPIYRRNRELLTVVGYGCMPDDKCFCHSMGTSNVDDGFDLFLTPLEDRFMVTVASARGDEIIRSQPDWFHPATTRDTRDYLERLRVRQASATLSLDVTDLPYVLEMKKGDPVWEELGRRCLCCGSCSIVCPTCTCFNVADQVPCEGCAERVRTWDACLYHDYALVAGGHSFRESRADRVKNRYYHKQEAFVREFGKPSCVGCGRCIENCPTGIHVVDVFKQVRGDA